MKLYKKENVFIFAFALPHFDAHFTQPRYTGREGNRKEDALL